MRERLTSTDPPKTSPPKVRGRPFQKGNPGRPRGSCNKATLAARQLLEGRAKAITKKCIELALQGDLIAIKLCLERLVPVVRAELVELEARLAKLESMNSGGQIH
jgi:hypothetical protein